MPLYDLAVGDGHQADRGTLLLAMLDGPYVARFRDAWVEKGGDGPVIAIYTRQGGGNRACYCEADPCACSSPASNAALAAHPLYIRDADDSFDSTYATFYFRVPDEFRDVLADAAVEPVDTDARWQAAIDRISSGDLRPAETALGDQIGAMLADSSPDAPKVMGV